MKSNKFNLGDTVCFIDSSNFIRKATIINCSSDFYTIRFETGNSGPSGIRAREGKNIQKRTGSKGYFGKLKEI